MINCSQTGRSSASLTLSISRQIPILMGCTLLFSLFFASIVAVSQLSKISREQTKNLGEILVQQTALSARDSLISNDRLSLNVILTQLTQSPVVAQASIYSKDDQRLAKTISTDYNANHEYTKFSATIDYSSEIVGKLYLELDTRQLRQPVHNALWTFIGITLLLALTGTVVAWNYARSCQMRLRRCIMQLIDMGDGNTAYSHTVNNEIAQLSSQLAYFATKLEENKRINTPPPAPATPLVPAEPVKVAAPAPVIETLRERSQPREAVVLALRITNFNQLHRELGQNEMIALLEQQLPHIHQAAKLNNGTLEYSAEGNAYISFSKKYGADPAIFKAICCAYLIENLFTQLQADGAKGLVVSQGISTINPQNPGENHPSLSDAATSQALLLASLGQGKLLLDGHYTDENLREIQATLRETTMGEDIYEIVGMPESYKQMLERQTNKILGVKAEQATEQTSDTEDMT